MVTRPAERGHASLYVAIEGARVRDVAARTKNNFGGLGGELTAGIRRAGLHNDGPSLNRTRNIERAAHPQKLSRVVENMEHIRVETGARFHVANERIVGPAIPQARHHVIELASAPIAGGMLDMFLEAKIH